MYDATQSEVMAAAIVESSTSALKVLCSSSRVNTTPARGALKAAARPAPAPQVIRSLSSVRSRPLSLEKPFPTMAPSWMLGPSRPSESPPPTAIIPPMNFAIITLSQFAFIFPSSSPFTWGIPLPVHRGSLVTINETHTVKKKSSSRQQTTREILVWAPSSSTLLISSTFVSDSRNAETRIPARSPTPMPSIMSLYFIFPSTRRYRGMASAELFFLIRSVFLLIV